MINVKKQSFKISDAISDKCKLEDITYNLYLNSKIIKSEDDITNGNVMSIEESVERIKSKYEGFNI